MTMKKYGLLPKRVDPRTLQLSNYIKSTAPIAIPAFVNWGKSVNGAWGMMLNDQVGDCGPAAVGHAIMALTAANGNLVTPADADVLSFYEAVGGYDPAIGASTDKGTALLDDMNYWKSHGMAGHQISAYVELNEAQVRQAIALFGVVLTGVQLPLTAEGQYPWYVTDPALAGSAAPGSLSSHGVPLVGYDTNTFFGVSWAADQWMTEDWLIAYGYEYYTPISVDWVPPVGVAPNSFDMAQLQADLAAL
jgi:hypothetical protein